MRNTGSEVLSSSVLRRVPSDAAAEPISPSYLRFLPTAPGESDRGESRQQTLGNNGEIMPPLFHLFTPSLPLSLTHFKHSPSSVGCGERNLNSVTRVAFLHRYIMAAPLFTLSSSSSLSSLKGAINATYAPSAHVRTHFQLLPTGSTHGLQTPGFIAHRLINLTPHLSLSDSSHLPVNL